MSKVLRPSSMPAVAAALGAIVEALRLSAVKRRSLADYVDSLAGDGEFPKLPHVSFFGAATRAGGVNYRITYRVPGYPRRTERLGRLAKPAYQRACRVSEVLQQVHARLMDRSTAHRMLYVDNTPIATHVAAFVASLKAKQVDEDYRQTQETRVSRCVELAKYARLSDITPASLPGLIEALRKPAEDGTRIKDKTINYYLQALRQFVKWAKGAGRMAEDTLQHVAGLRNVESDKRRDLLPEELAAVVAHARADARREKGLAGPERAMLYLVAFGTGYRAGELRAIEAGWVWLNREIPAVFLPGKFTKNGKDALQPLPAWLAMELRGWLGDRTSGRLFSAVPSRVAEMFDADRAAARAAWVAKAQTEKERGTREASPFLQKVTPDGELVFHSLRHAYASQLVASMDLKSAQRLTRHATVAMLGDRYAHSRMEKAAAAVDRAIPNPLATGALAQGAAQSDGQ